MTETEPAQLGSELAAALHGLPLLGDDIYLAMQATNLGMVDDALSKMEADLLREYFADDRTPLPTAAFLSALSQLWIFGVYELLRTWRQRVHRVVQLGSKPASGTHSTAADVTDRLDEYPSRVAILDADLAEAAADLSQVAAIRDADDQVNSLFKRIEALRVHLAKHEVPKASGSVASAPGYGRINAENGSIYYQFEVRPPEVDVLSRREVADRCRALATARSEEMLPDDIRRVVERFPEIAYGAKRIRVTLKDGRVFDDVFVRWNREIASVGTHNSNPFDARETIRAENQYSVG